MQGERKKRVREDRDVYGDTVAKKIVVKFMLAREQDDSTPA